ncbi:MAG TPA: hypothetical protein VD993_20435 [Chitinophagaceae bacterium]|nr:hypothetical protein [Chitinophagaceae bacterium]
MKLKAALVLTLLVCSSLISLSNRCGRQCDGRRMTIPVATITSQPMADDKVATETEQAGSSTLLRMMIAL